MELVKMVKEMRDLQKKYFATRDRNILAKSKEAERRVDLYVKDLLDKQTKIF